MCSLSMKVLDSIYRRCHMRGVRPFLFSCSGYLKRDYQPSPPSPFKPYPDVCQWNGNDSCNMNILTDISYNRDLISLRKCRVSLLDEFGYSNGISWHPIAGLAAERLVIQTRQRNDNNWKIKNVVSGRSPGIFLAGATSQFHIRIRIRTWIQRNVWMYYSMTPYPRISFAARAPCKRGKCGVGSCAAAFYEAPWWS